MTTSPHDRRNWINWTGDHKFVAGQIAPPIGEVELIELVLHAIAARRPIGIVGSARSLTAIVEASDLPRYVVEQGSIAVDGVDDESSTDSLIPDTLQPTTLGGAESGTAVNLEVDVLAKYVEKLMGARSWAR